MSNRTHDKPADNGGGLTAAEMEAVLANRKLAMANANAAKVPTMAFGALNLTAK